MKDSVDGSRSSGSGSFVLWVLVIAILLALIPLKIKGLVPHSTTNEEVPAQEVEPIEYQGGVTYFPCTGETYHRVLGRFIEEHPGLNCKYAGPHIFYPDPHIRGHVWVCTDIAQDAQEQTVQ